MMSLKPMPGFGKSGTSRIFALQVDVALSCRDESAQVAPERSCESSCASSRERLEVLESPAAPLGVPRAERRRDELLEQRRPRGRPPCGTCAGAAARCRSARARRSARDVGVASRGRRARRRRRAARAGRTPRARARARGVDPGALAELVEVELVLLVAEPRARGGACALGDVGDASSWRITRSGRNSSRCRRRIVSSRSTSSSLKSR